MPTDKKQEGTAGATIAVCNYTALIARLLTLFGLCSRRFTPFSQFRRLSTAAGRKQVSDNPVRVQNVP
jgi:hypothetical protein